jgi:hypothetical protein
MLRLFMMMLYLLNLSTDAHATASYFCFKTDHQQNILLVSAEEFPEIKTIQYYPYLKRIDLKFSHYDAIDTARDRPSEFHDFYKEIIDNQVMGTYEVIYQGAMFSTINHTAKNNHRPTKFERIYHLDPNTRQNLNRQGIDCF